MAVTLYRRQKQVLEYIKNYIAKHEAAPTLREIADHFKLSSLATVHAHLKRLEEKGYIGRDYHGERGIRVTDPREGPLFREIMEVPLYGYLEAGQHLYKQDKQGAIVLPVDMVGNRSVYALKIQGDGFLESNLRQGDVLIIESRDSAEHGHFALVRFSDRTVALKRIYYEQGTMRLVADGHEDNPIFVQHVEIVGVVVCVVRSY